MRRFLLPVSLLAAAAGVLLVAAAGQAGGRLPHRSTSSGSPVSRWQPTPVACRASTRRGPSRVRGSTRTHSTPSATPLPDQSPAHRAEPVRNRVQPVYRSPRYSTVGSGADRAAGVQAPRRAWRDDGRKEQDRHDPDIEREQAGRGSWTSRWSAGRRRTPAAAADARLPRPHRQAWRLEEAVR